MEGAHFLYGSNTSPINVAHAPLSPFIFTTALNPASLRTSLIYSDIDIIELPHAESRYPSFQRFSTLQLCRHHNSPFAGLCGCLEAVMPKSGNGKGKGAGSANRQLATPSVQNTTRPIKRVGGAVVAITCCHPTAKSTSGFGNIECVRRRGTPDRLVSGGGIQ